MDLGSPESLPSEDWISQPRSSAQVSLKGGSSPAGSLSNASQSRIPRHTRSTSTSSLSSRASANHRPFSPSSNKSRSILNERTASALNISERRSSTLQKGRSVQSGSLDSRNISQISSVGPQDVGQLGTVQHKTHGKLGNGRADTKATPEWKKRVLAGGITSGRQQDLFSPIGLERVFSTTVALKPFSKPGPRPKNKTFEAVAIDEYPSSPPPYPSTGLGRKSRVVADPQSPGTPYKKQSSVVRSDRQLSSKKSAGRADLSQISQGTPQRLRHPPNVVGNGESDLGNESISIVQISNGRINWDSVAKSRTGPRSDVRQHTRRISDRPQSRASDSALCNADGITHCDPTGDQDYPELTTQSLPDGLSIDTEAFASRGGFINLRRGGYSMNDSFHKRPLSPSSFQASELSAPDSDATFREEQECLGRQAVNTSAKPYQGPPVPTTPKRSSKDHTTPELPKSSGSPLKLFDNYDSFTNDRLVRRMSQFERNVHASPDSHGASPQATEAHERSLHKSKNTSKQQIDVSSHRISSFGDGRLDGFDFSMNSPDSNLRSFAVTKVEGAEQRSRRSPRSSQGRGRSSKSNVPFTRSRHSSRGQSILGGTSESLSQAKILQLDVHDRDNPHSLSEAESFSERSTQELVSYNAERKRCLASPSRASNPKRRRTITGSVNSPLLIAAVGWKLQQSMTQSILPQKRKDARYEHSNQLADPEIIANRTRLRPRALTQTTSYEAAPNVSTEGFVNEQDLSEPGGERHVDNDQSFFDEPVQALAGELAHFALDIAQDITYGTRKTSVTTADFTKQAKLIMQNIRAQALPRSGRTSEQNFRMEPVEETEESLNEGSTREAFSRPPSREGGGTLRNFRGPTQPDPRVVSHLRKFEENDDSLNVLSPLLRPLKPLGEEVECQILESDPPNIHIRESLGKKVSQTFPPGLVYDSLPSNGSDGKQSRRSPPSTGPSTTRTIPTGSSGGSGNKAVIPPEKVSHLLCDNVAGMTFDRNRKVWIRKKSAESHNDGIAGSDVTEEDPLKEIPDLSVDEAEEMRRIKMVTTSSQPGSNGTAKITDTETPGNNNIAIINKIEQSSTKPTSPEQRRSDMLNSETEKYNSIESTNAKTSTRATSVSEHPQIHSTSQPEEATEDEEIEHEISILDGRSPGTPKQSMRNHRQPRVVTVAFSSPLIHSTFRPQAHPDIEDGSNWEDESELCLDESPEREVPEERYSCYRKTSQGSRSKSGYRRRGSLSANNFFGRPVSRIDEHDELVFADHARQNHSNGMNVILSTPQAFRSPPGQITVASANDKPPDLTFYLSPLSDFTIHQGKDATNHEAGCNVRSHGLLSKRDCETRYSLAIQELVQKITDVEPYEPYWEYLRKLSLQNKGLTSLHMLDDFCSRIDELHVPNNQLRQVDGVPVTVRSLDIRNNFISSLTPWGHLRNLQYVDVSGNQLQSLEGFSVLLHLRELIADDNQIESLDGVKGLDGLLKLRLRRNKIEVLDFQGAEMHHLIELDVQSNHIAQVGYLHELPALKILNLRDNELLDLVTESTAEMPSLQTLDVSDNRLTTINATCFPNLQFLKLDRNRINRISNSKQLGSLTAVSWREQNLQASEANAVVDFEVLFDITALQLSGNRFQHLSPMNSFLNLQRLELAFAGLEGLASDFGLQMPNLRYLNLNHNALKDLRPLLGIRKIAELHVVGNRIMRLRRTAAVLRKLGDTLQSLDMRDNPLTVGFYAPSGRQREVEQRLVFQTKHSFIEEENAEEIAAAAYIAPPADQHADQHYCQNLAEDTALRRRVYEMLVMGGCPVLSHLDGLPIERRGVESKDALWNRLLALGVLQEKGSDC